LIFLFFLVASGVAIEIFWVTSKNLGFSPVISEVVVDLLLVTT
jgi:hypothetical protein